MGDGRHTKKGLVGEGPGGVFSASKIKERALREEFADYRGLVADTPMRRLRKVVTRSDVEVYGKLEGTNLGGSVKDRAALGMIDAARRAGHLDGRRIVEATSGNTGIALAMIAALEKLPITLLLPASATP